MPQKHRNTCLSCLLFLLLPSQARLDAARAKATSIAAQDDMPMSSKMKEIEKVYAKARAGGGAKGKGGKAGKGAGEPPIS
jgi:hypothetical protein